MLPESYNIRVYGLCLSESGEVLVTDERRGRYVMTKFPGGGHQLGEGLAETVKREYLEETNTEIEVLGLFYINDFLQISAFDPRDQILSVYYLVRAVGDLQVPITEKTHDFGEGNGDMQTFRWTALEELEQQHFTFPIDKIVAEKLKQNKAKLSDLSQGFL